MRRSVITLSTAAALTLLAAPASAAPPLEPLPPMPPKEFSLCGTTVLVEEVMNKAKENTKTGRITGALKIRLTNLENDQSVVVNASGPGFITAEPDEKAGTLTITFDFRGRSLIFPFTAEEQVFFEAAGLPDIFTTRGPFVGTLVLPLDDPAGAPIASTFDVDRNRVRNVCDQITSDAGATVQAVEDEASAEAVEKRKKGKKIKKTKG